MRQRINTITVFLRNITRSGTKRGDRNVRWSCQARIRRHRIVYVELPNASFRGAPYRGEIIRRTRGWLTTIVADVAWQETKNRNTPRTLRQIKTNCVSCNSAFHLASVEGPHLRVLKRT